MKRRELEKTLYRLQWRILRHGRNHDVWSKDEHEIAIPRHNEINEYTAKKIIADAKGKKR